MGLELNIDQHNSRPGGRKPRGYRKRVLALRAMAGETAWLDGRLLWQEGRVVWESRDRLMCPGVGDIALAQRRLRQIARYPIAAERAFGDRAAWLARRFARLELAKRLHAIPYCDLPELIRHPQSFDSHDVSRLVTLLVAEAVCHNTLPASPSSALAACGERAHEPLLKLICDSAAPVPARALAALTLAAIHRQVSSLDDPAGTVSMFALDSPWLQRAYAWGLRHGLPTTPALLVRLLAGPDGASLARRYAIATRQPNPFTLPTDSLRDLLAAGTPPERVVALVEALAAAESVAVRIKKYRHELPERPAYKRREAAERLERERGETVAALARKLREYACSTADPHVVWTFVALAHLMLDLGPTTRDLLDHVLEVFREGLSLPPALRRAYLDLLIEERERMWNPGCGRPVTTVPHWLDHCRTQHIERLRTLLEATRNLEIVREALELNVYKALACYTWRDLDRYRLALSLARDLNIQGDERFVYTLCDLVGSFGSMRAANNLIQPLMRALMLCPADRRGHLLQEAIYAIRYEEMPLRPSLTRLVRFLPRIGRAAHPDGVEGCRCNTFVLCALAVDRAYPGTLSTEAHLDWLFQYLVEQARARERGYDAIPSVYLWACMALTVAPSDLGSFQTIVRTVVEHDLDFDYDRLRETIKALARFPALHAPLAEMFPRQPQRCVKLLTRFGLVPRLGSEATRPLAALSQNLDQGGERALPPDWEPLAEVAPELVPVALAYLYAQSTLCSSDALPPGVRRALEQPRKWAGELAYIERLLQEQPDRADLATRARNLHLRLADPAGITSTIRGELAESLAHIAGEAQLAAAEHLVNACYRARLESLAGPLPVGTIIDDNLLNATLLATDITKNRRLLLKLLRAYLSGDRRWPERQPANVAFLEGLQKRGVDTAAWLGSHPLTYRCKGVAGGRVRLLLERDPLHILQMGNYFDTCLRMGGFNSFSTVANACELNKRVVYAYDGEGRVVGRKLIALNADGNLVGFYTYSTLGDHEGGKEMRAIFSRYAARFAEKCGITLANQGTVPTLYARDWYHDGLVPWQEEEKVEGPKS